MAFGGVPLDSHEKNIERYLSEAAHVKKLVGPERIRRNKANVCGLRVGRVMGIGPRMWVQVTYGKCRLGPAQNPLFTVRKNILSLFKEGSKKKSTFVINGKSCCVSVVGPKLHGYTPEI